MIETKKMHKIYNAKENRTIQMEKPHNQRRFSSGINLPKLTQFKKCTPWKISGKNSIYIIYVLNSIQQNHKFLFYHSEGFFLSFRTCKIKLLME